MRILIADDDEIVRAVVERVCRSLDYESIEARDGLDALRLIERHDPDVLVTDLRMPILDGFELVAALRKSPVYHDLPIVCLSSVSDREAIAQLAGLGITDYLLKPVRTRDLAERLHMVAAKLKAAPDRPGEGAFIVLVISPDAAFRSLVEASLAPDFTVLKASSPATGLGAFQRQLRRVSAVVLSDGLDLLDEARTADLIRQVASAEAATPPPILLATDSSPSHPPDTFDDVIRRSISRDDLRAAVTRLAPVGRAP